MRYTLIRVYDSIEPAVMDSVGDEGAIDSMMIRHLKHESYNDRDGLYIIVQRDDGEIIDIETFGSSHLEELRRLAKEQASEPEAGPKNEKDSEARMPTFHVSYWLRHYNGAMTVQAVSPENARQKVEDMDSATLIEHAADSYVEIEGVEAA